MTFSQCYFGANLESKYENLKNVPVDGDEKLLSSNNLTYSMNEKLNFYLTFVKILDEISSKRSNVTNIKISVLGKSLIFSYCGIVRMIELSSS